MKKCLTILACAALCACSSDESSVEPVEENTDYIIGVNDTQEPVISYCFPRYLTAPETRTIAEVFTGEEVSMGHLIIRTELKKRAGMYFFIMFGYAPDEIAMACTFELTVDTNMSPAPKTYTFTVPETYSTLREVKLGITGSDWPSPDAKVNAWKLVLKSPAGKVITEKESWLWSLKQNNRNQENTDRQLKEVTAK